MFARLAVAALVATVLSAAAAPSFAGDVGQTVAVRTASGAIAAGLMTGIRIGAPGMTQGVVGPETQRRVGAVDIVRTVGQPPRLR